MIGCKVKFCRFKDTHVTRYHQCGKCNNYGHGGAECNNRYLKNNLERYSHDILPYNKHCTFGGCDNKEYHTIDAHHCTLCNNRYHSKETCEKNIKEKNINIQCPICKEHNEFSSNQKKVYGLDENCCICLSNKVEVYFPSCGHICICIECCNKMTAKKSNKINEEIINQRYDVLKIKNSLKKYPSCIELYEGMGCFTIIRRLNNDSCLEGLFIHSDDNYDIVKVNENEDFIKGYACIDRLSNDNLKLQ